MTINGNRILSSMILAAVFLVVGCTETRYVPMKKTASRETSSFIRTVEYEIDPAYQSIEKECLVILPPQQKILQNSLSVLVESALTRNFADRVNRLAHLQKRKQGIDLQILGSQELVTTGTHFAVQNDCENLLLSKLTAQRTSFLTVWTELRIGLELELMRVKDQRILWRARHVATRSRGGFPLSIPGMIINSVSATSLLNNHDVIESLVDDAIRRLTAALPS